MEKIYPDKVKVSVGMATCGLATGAGKVFKALADKIEETGADIILASSGCLGFCEMEPLVCVQRPGKPKVVYSNLMVKQVDEFFDALIAGEDKEEWVLCRMDGDEMLMDDSRKDFGTDTTSEKYEQYEKLPFFSKQLKIVLRNCGFIDPEEIDEYIARGGYSALEKALAMKPEEVIEEIKQSGLRGRGGAGFPTGLKWDFCRKSPGDEKYIICNADEGDPGAYMDRSVLEGDPHSVIEGMLIGAYAIGAQEGVLYVRTEYPLAIERLKTAIGQATEYGFLGDSILKEGFRFTLSILEGAGAFVCGEETSLIASIEGKQPEPRPRPPFPAQSGLWGKPTNINNVETWANIPAIMARGAEWYSSIGTEKSKGTKVFSLVGAVRNTGLIEVPMGTSLKDIIYEIGGGIQQDKKLKAVQTGGPSGGCIPADKIDMSVDYERLAEAGSIMGSGGMVVMDESNCMVDIAKFFTSFTREESCGKCTSCRDGLDAALQLLEKITEGEAEESDLELLEELSEAIKDASQCGLGTTAPNPILSTLQFFRDEYEAHVKEKKCPAAVCKALFQYQIEAEACKACGKCKIKCPHEAIEGERKVAHKIVVEKCTKCGMCFDVCPFDAVIKV